MFLNFCNSLLKFKKSHQHMAQAGNNLSGPRSAVEITKPRRRSAPEPSCTVDHRRGCSPLA